MKSSLIAKLTIIAFLLIPVLAIVRLLYYAPRLSYGKGQIALNSVFLLLFGIYCFIVSAFHFVYVNRYWSEGNSMWKQKMGFAYLYTILFALSLALLFGIGSGCANVDDFMQMSFLGIMFISLAFLFPIGLVLLFLGFKGLTQSHNKPKSYLVITFLTSLLFSLGGVMPALAVFSFWIQGGISMCYCPVNRRSFKRDFLFKPLYWYRRKKLIKNLNI